MEAIATILFVAGLVVQAIGSLWMLVEMFKTHVGWGLVQIFCCGLAFVPWLFGNWERGKEPFLIAMVGIAMMGVGFAMGYRGAALQFLLERNW